MAKGYKYQAFIEDNFLIDDPKTSKLVPFKFRAVQQKLYDHLVEKYDIENVGISAAVRVKIVKARKQGFSSMVLALFAADDILQDNPTNTQVLSYKDDATKVFRTRYKTYVMSWARNNTGNPDLREKDVFSKNDGGEFILAHNNARFTCGTASARTAERGSTVTKLLFSESAHYPDTENMTAKEIIEGTLAQMDLQSGWCFDESTANGKGNYHHKQWEKSVNGEGRFDAIFYGWREFYTEEEYKLAKSQSTDPDMFGQEYPETVEDAFVGSGNPFTNLEALKRLVEVDKGKEILEIISLKGDNYIHQCEILN